MSVITTVNTSPFTAPVTTGFCAVLLLKVADPFVLHSHVTASPPTSYRLRVEPSQTGLEFEAVAVCAMFSLGINRDKTHEIRNPGIFQSTEDLHKTRNSVFMTKFT
jgi:hypothetical protein